ncbi:ubiquitin-activating enzyme E1 [Gracilaria domingensis]|nr:ubiquitin-activating enzyme E1 [Gracilaria domingensis]
MQTGDESVDVRGWKPGGPSWGGLDHLLRNAGPLSGDLNVEGADSTENFLRQHCKVLIIGAGGLGCELLKDVALSGFRHIHVIDLDTIDVTNLNRQFLFRSTDVGKSKAEVAAQFVNSRVPGCSVVAHHANIMDFESDFYQQFNIVIAGLDSVEARRWLNAMLVSLVQFDSDGSINRSSVIPLIDGGTEGFQGQARIIFPRFTSCFECTLNLFPPQQNYPFCTIANTPRLPEHCIEYANVILWDKRKPFGSVKLDMDNVEHTTWLYETAKARAEQFGIEGVTLRLTQGVAKNIIPAVASTNAIVAAACANEALKMISCIATNMDNYMMYNGTMGVYTYTYKNEKRPDCPVCGVPQPKTLNVVGTDSLAEFLEQIAADPDIRSKKPFLRSNTGKTLYASTSPLREATQLNLEKRLNELITSGTEVTLADRDLPFIRTLVINYK